MNIFLCFSAVLVALILLIPVAAWLTLRRRFANPDFFTFLRFVADYAGNKWRKKPDLWSILRYFQRFLRNIRIKVAFQRNSFASERDRRTKLDFVLSLAGDAAPLLQNLFKEHRFEARGLVLVGHKINDLLPPEGFNTITIESGLPDEELARQERKPWDFNFVFFLRDGIEAADLLYADEMLRYADLVLATGKFLPAFGDLLRQKGFEGMPGSAFWFRKNVVSMTTLGAYGQFGNQILQYAFLKTYALRHGARSQVLPWVGQMLFARQDPPPERVLPRVEEKVDVLDMRKPFEPAVNVDLAGFFHYQTSYYTNLRGFIRSLYQPRPEVSAIVDAGLEKLRKRGRTIVALHLRHSTWDCGHHVFFIAPCEWYLAWLKALWPKIERPVLFIAADVPEKVLPYFSEYDPYTCERLGIRLDQADFYGDYFMLTQADALAISNSSFSFTASMLNEQAVVFMRPDNELKKLVSYDPWNCDPILLQYC